MGIDFLDLRFRVEREFKIKIDQNDVQVLLDNGNATEPPKGKWADIQVRDFVSLIKKQVEVQNPTFEGDVFETVKPLIAECLAIEESEIFLESWFRRDLGME